MSSRDGDDTLARDTGFLHGDGVFETIRVLDGRPLFWDRHRTRLSRGLAHLGVDVDLARDVDPLVLEHDSIATDGSPSGSSRSGSPHDPAAGDRPARVATGRVERVRISISRGPMTGETGRGGPPTVRVTRTPLPPIDPTALLVLTGVTRPGPTALPPWVKPLAYLPFVLARREALAAGGTDGLMLDAHEYLSECDCANLFFSLGATLFTPGAATGRLEGVMRGVILEEAAKLGIPVIEGRHPLILLERATEIFVTNALRGIRPVTEVILPQSRWLAPTPRPLTDRLMGAIHSRIATELGR